MVEPKTTDTESSSETLKPLKTWIKSHYNRCLRGRQRIEAFVAYYAGTQLEPMPFAGRSAWLQHLNQWLAQDQSRLLLLSGTAGRGKSALLLHWLAQLVRHPPPNLTLLFLPISLRFETSNELEGLRLLHAALCDVFENLRFSPQSKPDITDYRDRLFNAWEHVANHSGQRYLLAIDGIDESANHWILKEVLPMDLPANLHLLLSASDHLGQADGTSWLRVLNQQSGKLLALTPLDPSAIADAIIQLGRPLDELAEQQAFVEQLYRLTDQGDPLLLTLWIGQIWQHRQAPPQVEQLQRLKPSFAGFYKTGLKEQEKIWKEQSIAIHFSDFNRLMQVLASAYGPLRLEHELIEVLKQIPSPVSWTYPQLREVLTTASRLVVGDGEHQGLSLIHPRLNDYFQSELAKYPAHQRQVHEAYLHWGAQVVADLNQGKLMPDSCPLYLLHHYTEHVAVAPVTVDVLEKYWLPLLKGGWHQAWEAYEGAWNGFLSDLQRVVQALRQYNQACYDQGERTAMKLAAEVRCALILVSIYTLNQNFPVELELVVQLVKAGLWSLSRAERVVVQFEPEKQIDCLAGLAEIVLPKDQSRLLQQALTIAENIQEEWHRTRALTTLVSKLGREPHLLQRVLIAMESIQEERYRAEILTALASQLVGEPCQQILQQALIMARNIQDEESRPVALIALASQLVGELRQQVSQQALTATENIQDEWRRAKILTTLAPLLRGEPYQSVWQQVLIMAENIQDEWLRAKVLTTLVPLLTGESRQQILQQALTLTAKHLTNESPEQTQQQFWLSIEHDFCYNPTEILVTLAPQLVGKPHLLQQALNAAKNTQDEEHRVKVLTALAPQLAGEYHLLQQALSVVRNIQSERYRIEALTGLAPQLAGEYHLLQQALSVARNIQSERYRTQLLTVLTSQSVDEPRQQVPQLALATIQDEREYAQVLTTLIPQLVGETRQQVLQQVLATTKNIRDESPRAKTLSELIPLLAGEPHLLQQALTVAGNLQEESTRTWVLIKLIPLLSGEAHQQALQQALTAARNILDEGSRVRYLTDLIPLLTGELRQPVLQQALVTVGNIQDESFRAEALREVAPLLVGESHLLQQALNVAENIQNESFRAEALTALALQLVGEPRQQVLQKALTAARSSIPDKRSYAQVLTDMIFSQLTDELRQQILQQTLTAVEDVQEEQYCAWALTRLASQLTGQFRQRILQQAWIAAENIQDEPDRAQALTKLATWLTDESRQQILQQALTAARNIQSEESRSRVLTELASQLVGELRQPVLQQALTDAGNIRDEWPRADALIRLFPLLVGEPHLLRQVLTIVKSFRKVFSRARVLTELAPLLVEKTTLQKDFLKIVLAFSDGEKRITTSAKLIQNNPDLLTYSLWTNWLEHAPLKRSELFEVTGELCTVAIQLTGNPQETNEIVRAVMDVVRWWP